MNSDRPVLVTGGAGFVGSHLVRRLRSDWGVDVVSLDNYFTGSVDNHVEDERVTYLEGDTNDVERLWQEQGLPAPSMVFHLGEYARIAQSFDDFDLVWRSNVAGTAAVVRLARDAGARIVYAGSSSKFGNEGADEHLSPYAWTKAKNVELLANMGDWFGLDYVVVYFFNVYGPGHITSGDYATVIGIFEEHYLAGRPLPVVSPGTQTRDFTHVDDIVEGILVCARDGKGDPGYLLGTGTEWRIIDVAELFDAPIEMVPPRRGERVSGRADTSVVAALGWRPTTSLPDYVEDFKARSGTRRGSQPSS